MSCSSPQSAVRHIFNTLSSDYQDVLCLSNVLVIQCESYLCCEVFANRIPSDAFYKAAVLINLLYLLCIEWISTVDQNKIVAFLPKVVVSHTIT